jgi:catechol 2,3-dioxygenase-like lactoylglutathione lyase family enzyme
MHFNHIALYVADLKKSAAFYRDVIGAEIIDDPFRDNRHVWVKIGEHNQLHLIAVRTRIPVTSISLSVCRRSTILWQG